MGSSSTVLAASGLVADRKLVGFPFGVRRCFWGGSENRLTEWEGLAGCRAHEIWCQRLPTLRAFVNSLQTTGSKRALFLGLLLCWSLALIGMFFCHSLKPLPWGLSFQGEARAVKEIRFLTDLTFVDGAGVRKSEQTIFDAVFDMIERAESFVLIDMFLFNAFLGQSEEPLRRLSSQLTDHLVAKKTVSPEVEVVVITDPINTVYGGQSAPHLERLRAGGVRVVMTTLEPLRDSNPGYSSFWRLHLRWLGNSPGGLLPNPFGKGHVSVRSFGRLLNFKANHRKVIVSDDADGLIGLVTSANPHDGSSAHENVALQFRGEAVWDLLTAENAVLTMSGALPIVVAAPRPERALFLGADELTIQVRTESRIKEAVLQGLRTTGAGDVVMLAMFYLSHPELIDALCDACERGAMVRVMLDSNQDAFGRQKSGVPNRPVAARLRRAGVELRWRETHGEQSHSKVMMIEYRDGGTMLTSGSANYTRRNLDDLNLELNVVVRGPREAEVFAEVHEYFETLWDNEEGRQFTVPYDAYADESWWRRWQYRLQSETGLSTF